jgi:hypothetical protein
VCVFKERDIEIVFIERKKDNERERGREGEVRVFVI